MQKALIYKNHVLWSAKADPGNQDWTAGWLEQLLRALLVAAGLKLCTWKYAVLQSQLIIRKLLLHFVDLQIFHSVPKGYKKNLIEY